MEEMKYHDKDKKEGWGSCLLSLVLLLLILGGFVLYYGIGNVVGFGIFFIAFCLFLGAGRL